MYNCIYVMEQSGLTVAIFVDKITTVAGEESNSQKRRMSQGFGRSPSAGATICLLSGGSVLVQESMEDVMQMIRDCDGSTMCHVEEI